MTEDLPAENSEPAFLRLAALDVDDLSVFSTHLQDAVTRVGDMIFLPEQKRFVLALNRFDWAGMTKGRMERCRAGLHFERVLGVSRLGFRQDRPNDILNLLHIEFTPGEAPSGQIVLTFSGGCALRLDVECLEGQMRDIGPRWPTRRAPGHPIDDAPEVA